ncbi:MAG: gliding motility-associated C-terminal domain-containing protein [Lewinellaceae bacterium]|nr:gliding motility-associated C-terminal domain-containing protein [Lewinellaceae bacterium]
MTMRRTAPRIGTTLLGLVWIALPYLMAQPQRRANIWHFGNREGLDFSCGRPVNVGSTEIISVEGATGICDENGKLLFYTNCGGGRRGTEQISGGIWNSSKMLMYDMGFAEGGGISATQGGVIVPDPASNSRYYLFTVDELESIGSPTRPHRGLSYFLVDMQNFGGQGSVVKSNVPVFLPAAECVTAARHSNGTDYWILTVDFESRDLVTVRVSASGVQPPVRYQRKVPVGPFVLKMTPDGQFLFDGTDLYRFDASDGSIEWVCFIDNADSYTFSFSPASRYLYAVRKVVPRELIRYDLQDVAIGDDFELVHALGDHQARYMQIGPDGNIYFNSANFTLGFDRVFVSAIQCPDNDTPRVVFNLNSFTVTTNAGPFPGLINLADFWFDDLQHEIDRDTLEKMICPDKPLVLQPACKGATYLWSNGATSERISVEEPGLYRVSITSGCFTVVESFKTVPGVLPAVKIEHDPFDNFCAATPLTLRAIATHADTLVWSTGSTEESILVDFGDRYAVTVANTCGVAEVGVEFPPGLCCSIFVPNIFSPGAYGINEQFRIAPYQCTFTDFQLRIFSRWGELAFESTDPAVAWSGTSGGKKWPAGVYVWAISYRVGNDPQSRVFRMQGNLTLIR